MSGSAGSGQATLRHDGGSAGGSGPVSDGFSPAGLKVLVVDDDLMCLKVVSAMLKRCSYQVATCSSGSEALTLLRERNEDGSSDQFDLVLSDVYMPDMDGFKLLEHIGLELELPVIMMSSNGDTNVVLRGVTHGAVDFLIKPVRIEELRNVWQHVVRRRSMALARTPDEGGHSDEDSQRHSVKRKESEQSPLQLSTEQGGNKKPRVVWSVEMHQQFVNAVNSLGIDKAVPKRILDLMNVEGLTRENVASHLQKYRLYLKRVEGVQSGAAASKHHQHPQYHQQQQQQQQAQPRAAVSPAAASFGALSLGAPQQAQQGMPQLGMPVQGLPPNLAAMGSQPPHIPFQQALAMQAAAAAAAASGALPGSLPPYMPPPGMMPPGMTGGVPGMGGVVGHPQMPAPGMDFAGFNGYGNAAGGLMFGGQQQAQHAQQHTSAQAGSLAQQQAQQVSMGLGLMPPSLGFPPTSLAAPAPRSTATEPAAAPLPLTSSPPAASAGGSGGPAAAAPQHSSGAAAAQPPHHHSQCSEQGAGGLPPPLPASSAPQSYPLPPPSSQAALHDPDEHYPPGSAEMHHQHLPGLCGFGPDDLLGGQLGDMGFLGELGGAVGGKHEQDDFLDLLLKGEEEL